MRMVLSLGRALIAATLLVAAVGAAAPAPASAAACASGDGVSVVVDFNQLGGVQSVCNAGGAGKKASAIFLESGFPITYVQRQPGFVCRVSGAPATDPCVNTPPASAYWALYWSDGKSGSWTYATLGVDSLTIPDGGYVALSWDEVEGSAKPSFEPAKHAAPSTPTPSPSSKPEPTKTPSTTTTTQPGSGQSSSLPTQPQLPSVSPTVVLTPSSTPTPTSASASPSRTPSAKPSTSTSASASATPSDSDDVSTGVPEPTGSGPDAQADAAQPDGGLPGWVAPALIGVLFGVAGVVFLVRRRPDQP